MARPRRTEPVADDENEARRSRWRWWFVAARKASGAPGGDALYAAMESIGDGVTNDEVLDAFGLREVFDGWYRRRLDACEVSRQLCAGTLKGPLDYGRPIRPPRLAATLSGALSAESEPVVTDEADRGAEGSMPAEPDLGTGRQNYDRSTGAPVILGALDEVVPAARTGAIEADDAPASNGEAGPSYETIASGIALDLAPSPVGRDDMARAWAGADSAPDPRGQDPAGNRRRRRPPERTFVAMDLTQLSTTGGN